MRTTTERTTCRPRPADGDRRRGAAGLVAVAVGVAVTLALVACTSSTGTSGPTGSAGTSPGTVVGARSTAPADGSTYAWTQLGPDGRAVVRSLADGDCPTARAGSAKVPLTEFAPPAPPAFPHRTCQADVPADAPWVEVDGHRLPAAPRKLDRIVVVGDIGCYVKSSAAQACNDPAAFPAKALAEQIAAAKPDLVVFVGDIYYTEDECPEPARCSGVPFGDRWATWAYDFFDPYRSALDAAPWIFVRGNHERCNGKDDNGGRGWFQLLAPTAGPCQDITDPYLVPVFDQRFVVFDTAVADDDPANAAQVADYVPKLRRVADLAAGQHNVWFVSHRPTWAAQPTKDGPVVVNATLQEANRQAGSPLNRDVDLFLAGHMHTLGAFTFADGRAGQLVSGGGGTELEKRAGQVAGTGVDGTTFSFGRTEPTFGYFVADRTGATASWRISAVELGGSVWVTCDLAGRALTCGG